MIGKTNSSTGVKINMTVVGGSVKPGSPEENTVWIDTAVTLTKWTAQYDEPADPVEGQAWVILDGYSSAGFSPIPDEKVMIYPISAKVYTSSAWVRCGGEVYTNGSWHPMRVYYYDAGNESSAITGGWMASSRKGQTNPGSPGTEGTDYTFTKNASNMEVTAKTNYTRAGMYTTNKVDLTHISTLHFKAKRTGIIGSTSGGAWVGVLTSSPETTALDSGIYAAITASEMETLTLDVSEVTGEYYIRAGARRAGNGTTDVTATLYEVYGD